MAPTISPAAMRRARSAAQETERGAVAIIVTLCLVAIMAMLMLTMDVGTLLLSRRAMVNAADAAALAAAQSCGLRAGKPDADGQIVKYAQDNAGGSYVSPLTTYTPSCDASSGTVTVHVKNTGPLRSHRCWDSPTMRRSAPRRPRSGAAQAAPSTSPL